MFDANKDRTGIASWPQDERPGPNSDPEERARAWPQALKECDFAGQIDVSEEELTSLVGAVRGGFENPIETVHRHATRVVFSVNCAYYAHDGGFWEYFCKRLNYENTTQNQGFLGDKIEQSLLHFGFLEKPGYGAYFPSPLFMDPV